MKRLILPDAVQVVVCTILTLLILVAVYHQTIFAQLASVTGAAPNYAQSSFQSQLQQLNQYVWLKNLMIGGFSAAVGIVAYIGYLMFTNLFIEARNEVLIDTQYINKGSLLGRLGLIIQRLLMIAILIILLYLSWNQFLPYSLSLIEDTLLGGNNWLASLGGLAAVWLNLYLIWTWIQFMLANR